MHKNMSTKLLLQLTGAAITYNLTFKVPKLGLFLCVYLQSLICIFW